MNWYKKAGMNSIPSMKGREVRRFMMDFGYQFYRQGKGSHEIWTGPGGQRITVPTHKGMFNKATFYNILKRMGVSMDQFRDYISRGVAA